MGILGTLHNKEVLYNHAYNGGNMQVGTLVKTLPTANKQLIGVVIDTGLTRNKILWNNGAIGWYTHRNVVEVLCK